MKLYTSTRMATKIVHFGLDHCNRVAVLKGVGYSVVECDSVAQVHSALLVPPTANAVAITENEGDEPHKVMSLVRATSTAPLILFQSENPHYSPAHFDLVVTFPKESRNWLDDIAELIAS